MREIKTGRFIKRNIDREWLFQKYAIEEVSWSNFYEDYGISPTLLQSRLKEFKISRKRVAWNKNTKKIMKPNKTSFKKGHEKSLNAYKYEKGYIPSKAHNKHRNKGIIESYQNGRIPSCPMLGKSHSLKSRLKISKNRKGKCKGEKHSNWKGGISPEEMLIRTSLEYRLWKLEVYKKDKGVCQICDKRCNNKDIVAHHKKAFKDYIELRFKVSNGITLCRSCHAKLHQQNIELPIIKAA